MSSAIFPRLRGLTWPAQETIITSTRVSKHVSGREVRAQLYKYPLYSIELEVAGLSASQNASDWNFDARSLQTLQAFILSRAGQFDTFCLKKSLYTSDPCDSRAEGTLIGVGDGGTTAFKFQRWIPSAAPNAPYNEPAGQVEPLGLNVYLNGVLKTLNSDYTLTYPNGVTFTAAPAALVQITADYTFYWRVRFGDDTFEFSNIAKYLWQMKKLPFQTVKYP